MKNLQPVNYLSTPRLLQLCKLTLYKNRKQWLTGLLAASGLIIAYWSIPALFSKIPELTGTTHIDYRAGGFVFLIWGLLVTSDIFQDLHSSTTAYQSLTLPATSVEKFLTAWIITLPIFLLVSFAAILILSLITSLFYSIINSAVIFGPFISPFSPETISFASSYFLYNSIFLLGAVLFRKNNFLKTILAIITIVFSFILITTVVMFIIPNVLDIDSFTYQIDSSSIPDIISNTFTLVVAFTSLLLTYVLLKKRQVV